MRFLRLCLLIFVFLRFFSDPMVVCSPVFLRRLLRDDFVQRVFHDAFGTERFEPGDNLPHDGFRNDCLDGDPVLRSKLGDGG